MSLLPLGTPRNGSTADGPLQEPSRGVGGVARPSGAKSGSAKVRKLFRLFAEETAGFRPGLWAANLVPRLLPAGGSGRLRAALYRAFGVSVGRNSFLHGALTLGPGSKPSNLRIGERCSISGSVYVDAAAPVHIGDGVALGHHVMIITCGHEVGPSCRRSGSRRFQPVSIGEGAWVAARATLLPGVHVGAGAVVAAGAVVTRDVPADTLVGGVPARVLRRLDGPPCPVEVGSSEEDMWEQPN